MEVAAIELIKQLQKQDTRNEYILFAKEGEDQDCVEKTPNFSIQTFPSFSYFDWEQFKLPAFIKKAGLDFLHSTCNTGPVRGAVPLVLTLHDIIYLEKIELKGTNYQNFGNIYRRFVVPKVVAKSDFVITVSHFERTVILERLKLPEEKLKVIYNGVNGRFNINQDPEQLAIFRAKYNLPENFILFLGNTAPKKNTPNVVKGFVEYCNQTKDPIPLVILDYEKQFVAEALSGAGESQWLDKFIFPGYISPDQMPMMYAASSLFLYPSLRESFGMPILESMACGIPVITSTTSSMPEVSGDAALLVDPYKYHEIAHGITAMLSDQTLLHMYRQKGLHRAAQFTWEAAVNELLQIYDEVGEKW